MSSAPMKRVSCLLCGHSHCYQPTGSRALREGRRVTARATRRFRFCNNNIDETLVVKEVVSHGCATSEGRRLRKSDGVQVGFETIGGLTLEEMAASPEFAELMEGMYRRICYLKERIEHARDEAGGR